VLANLVRLFVLPAFTLLTPARRTDTGPSPEIREVGPYDSEEQAQVEAFSLQEQGWKTRVYRKDLAPPNMWVRAWRGFPEGGRRAAR
jgi:hypothetical protein